MRLRALGVLLLGLGLMSIGAAIGVYTAAAQPAPSAPVTTGGADAFQPILDVFKHPRCYNCHGGVDPFTGANHGGGVVPQDNETCINCHVDAKQYGFVTASDGSTQRVWRMAPQRLHIVGKSDAEICGMLHNFEAADPNITNRVSYHVSQSKMVLLAFEGKRAGASSSIDPPPGTLNDLTANAVTWNKSWPHCLKVELDPPSVDFGDVPVGDSRSMNVNVTNRGPAFSFDSLKVSSYCSASSCSDANAQLSSSTCAALQPGDSCSFQITVKPDYDIKTNLYISAQITGDAAVFGSTPYADVMSMLGSLTGVPPAAASMASLEFGDITLQQQAHKTVTVRNRATASSVTISNARIVSPLLQDAGDFQLYSSGPASCASTSYTLAPGATCVFDVLFAPDDIGNRKRWLAMDVKGWPEVSIALTGAGVALPTSSLTISVTSLDFGNQRVGTHSVAQSVAVTNPGQSAVNISSISLAGTYIPFSRTHNCPPTLAAGASCSIDVTYSPTNPGAHTTTLKVYSDAPGSPTDVALKGIGLQPSASVSPTSVWFGTIAVGTTASKTVTISNTGNDVLTVGSISVPSGFSQGNDCANGVAAGGTCSIVVTFAPTSGGGTFGGVMNITSNSPGSPHQVTIEGVAQGARLTLNTKTLDFGSIAVNTTSAAQKLTLTNDGLTTLTFAGMSFFTDFASPANTCGGGIAPGGSCTVDVTFRPLTSSTYSESAWLSTNSPGSPHEITLKGVGGIPQFTLSPSTLGFGPRNVGTTSPPQAVTLSNTGNVALTISSLGTTSVDFGLTTTCPMSPATLAVGANCAVNVTFSPIGGGNRIGQLAITTNAQPATQWLGLSGLAPSLEVNSPSVGFGSQPLNTTGAAQTVTVSNRGNSPLTITSVSIVGPHAADFSASTQACVGTQVMPERNCSIATTFRPSQTGARAAELRIAHNDPAASNPLVVSLGGNGTSQAVALDPSSADFGSLAVGSTSDPPRLISLMNNGTAPLAVQSASLSGANAGDFVVASSTCNGATLGVGSTCSFGARFRPTTGGGRSASLVVTDASGTTYTSVLSGIGLAGAVSLSPSTLQFGGTPIGVLSQGQNIDLRNTGNASLTGLNLSLGGANAGDFVYSQTCGATLSPAAACTITVKFRPLAGGSRTASMQVTSSAGVTSARMTGSGLAPAITVNQTGLSFGSQTVGTQSATQSMTVMSSGSAALSISSITVSGDFALVGHDCTLAPGYQPAGSSCTITLRFAPTVSGARSGSLNIATNASNSPTTVALNGTGS
jgi:hypothetical protein